MATQKHRRSKDNRCRLLPDNTTTNAYSGLSHIKYGNRGGPAMSVSRKLGGMPGLMLASMAFSAGGDGGRRSPEHPSLIDLIDFVGD
jgi:hypothetical protein